VKPKNTTNKSSNWYLKKEHGCAITALDINTVKGTTMQCTQVGEAAIAVCYQPFK